jgi:hypothetical protein
VTVIRELEHVTSKFLILGAEKADSGRYECQASNPFGKSYYHIQLQIWGETTADPKNSNIFVCYNVGLLVYCRGIKSTFT